MGMSAGGKGGIKSDINVTPLVDVVLVLLIIFMVVTPMLQRGKSVELPKADKEKSESKANADADPVVLSITAAKEIYVEDDLMPDASRLQETLRAKLAVDPAEKILLKGDSTLQVGDVRKVMETARKAQFKSIKLAVQEKK
jgi:biopolymer transport protein TolR